MELSGFWARSSAVRSLGIALAVVGSATLVACAAEVQDNLDASDDGHAAASDDDSQAPPTGPATVYDSGPPAHPYGDSGGLPQTDSAVAQTDGAPPINTSCTVASDCPGANQHDTVKCTSNKCDLSCQGEFYDVNGNPTDGCEQADSPIDVHTQAKAVDIGDVNCKDPDSTTALTGRLTGRIPSDTRLHETPAVDGFDKTSTNTDSPAGAAADWYKIHGTGGACYDDFSLDLQMNNVKQKNCYRLTLITDKQTQACSTDASGHCAISGGTGSYSDNSELYVVVEKLLDPSNGCPAGVNDDAEYNVSGHL